VTINITVSCDVANDRYHLSTNLHAVMSLIDRSAHCHIPANSDFQNLKHTAKLEYYPGLLPENVMCSCFVHVNHRHEEAVKMRNSVYTFMFIPCMLNNKLFIIYRHMHK